MSLIESVGGVVLNSTGAPEEEAAAAAAVGLPMEVYTKVVPCIIGLITAVGLVGNSIVVYVIVCKGHLKTVTNYYIVNLAITDISFLIFCAPLTAIIYATSQWMFGSFMCKFMLYMMQVTAQATCATLTAMSIDRYYAITDPLKSLKTRTPRVAIVVSVAIWTFPLIVYTGVQTEEYTMGNETYRFEHCVEMWPYPIFDLGYAVYSLVMLYLIPLTIIGVCYAIVLNRLWKAVSPTEETHAPVHLRMLRQKRRVTRMILAVVLAFAGCWASNYVMAVWRRADPNFPSMHPAALTFQIFAHMMAYLNSCVNPFVYAFMGGNFRRQMARAFPCLGGGVDPRKCSAATDGPTGSLIKSKSTQV